LTQYGVIFGNNNSFFLVHGRYPPSCDADVPKGFRREIEETVDHNRL